MGKKCNFAAINSNFNLPNMKKLLLSFYLLSVVAFYGYSQSLSLSNPAGPIVANSIIIQAGTPDSSALITYLYVTNTSARTVNIYCKKSTLSLMDSTSIPWCFANACYGSDRTISNLQIVEPGQTITDFHGDYSSTTMDGKFHSGESVVRWVFFAENDVNDSVSVTIKYTSYPLGIDETLAHQVALSGSIPNPANEKATFTYSIPSGSDGMMIIRNVVGSIVASEQVPSASGQVSVNTFNLSNGLYFCSLTVNGKMMVTRKMIVQH